MSVGLLSKESNVYVQDVATEISVSSDRSLDDRRGGNEETVLATLSCTPKCTIQAGETDDYSFHNTVPSPSTCIVLLQTKLPCAQRTAKLTYG